jgi:23S rRNA (guanine745-N1)-methyltransferase
MKAQLSQQLTVPHYRCPLCQNNLSLINNTYRCEQNHCFDQAKEGYVNLLPVQHKHSKDPGDNKEMVNARRAFLDNGFYQPLVDEITALQKNYAKPAEAVLDAGCGEGFYTHQHKSDNNQVYGVDIAKTAVKIAAKRYKNSYFSVGTLSQLPFSAQFFGWIFSIYAPILETEFTRVLQDDGYLLTVTPADNHLFELKSLIYREAKQHDTSKIPINNLSLIEEKRLNYMMKFTKSSDITNLLSMTPFAFKASAELLAELANKKEFSCQADFLIRLYQKKS